MQAILPILEFIQSILTKPAWIMGLFAFVGLVALKRPAHKVMTGTLKPILGYIMLSAGAAVVQENLAPLGTFIETGFHITGVVPNNEGCRFDGSERPRRSDHDDPDSRLRREHYHCPLYQV